MIIITDVCISPDFNTYKRVAEQMTSLSFEPEAS